MITTRLATPADLDAVSRLFDQYRQFYGKAPALEAARAFIRARMETASSILYVAEAPQRGVVAFCQLYPALCSVELARTLTLYDLFCEPAARRLGAGRALLIAAAADAWRAGYQRMDLSTARSNTTAQALYESLGWITDEVYCTYNLRAGAFAVTCETPAR
ncbi:MAG: N-acetyltransferase family protein [Steroidobacteraceae bacterium]